MAAQVQSSPVNPAAGLKNDTSSKNIASVLFCEKNKMA
jgi:hypothetical protein